MALATTTRKKISVNLQPQVAEMLDRIGDLKGLRQSEVLQEAIKLLDFITSEGEKGRQVYTIGKDGSDPKQLVLL